MFSTVYKAYTGLVSYTNATCDSPATCREHYQWADGTPLSDVSGEGIMEVAEKTNIDHVCTIWDRATRTVKSSACNYAGIGICKYDC